MGQIGFDNDKYLAMQSAHIRERISKFGGKLYLEFGGKLFDDFHASRVLPGFQPDSKIRMLQQLRDDAEIVIAVNANDIEKNKVRGDLGITYDDDCLRLIDAFRSLGLYVGGVCITQYAGQNAADAFIKRLNTLGVRNYRHYPIAGYPSDVAHIVSAKREPVGVQVATHGKVIGVVSPECHEMQELFSVMHAVNLGREQKVLYFNFLEFSGFRELFGQTGNFDFTDVVLKLRSGELTTEYFWNCVYEMSGISVILPFENPENIRQIGRQEWEQFIDFMEQNTDFEVLVVDFGVSMPELADCMSRCDELLLIGREGYFYECRDKHFYEWLEKTGHQAVAEKIHKVNVPYTTKNIHGGGNVIEQLQWSEFGDFVRRWKEIMDE